MFPYDFNSFANSNNIITYWVDRDMCVNDLKVEARILLLKRSRASIRSSGPERAGHQPFLIL